jgi:catechol 2,3-dioxygenase-like lactoylglutathione lyase family enzyme
MIVKRPLIFGAHPVSHLGFAVQDIEAAVEKWVATTGAGPFCRVGTGPMRLRDVKHRGEPAAWSHSTATGQWGEILLELFENHSAEPATLASAMGVGEHGLHHVGWFVEDIEAESARLQALGIPQVISAGVNEQDLVFHDARKQIGCRIELYGALPRVVEHYQLVRRAAVGWDGTDPLLALGEFRARYATASE